MNCELKDIQWGEYRIGDLFEKIKTNNIYKNVEPGDLPATTALLTNNQIGRYVNRKNATILKNVFSATANGTGRAFYQPYDFTVLQDSYAFKFKDKKINIKNIHPFIVCVLNTVYAKYDWGNKSGWEKVKNDFIKLPTKNNQIDFDFMEKYISLIKQESLNKLKEYLNKQTNNNYSLSTLEQDAINNFNDITWKEYRIGDLFEIYSTSSLNKDSLKDGIEFDYVTRTSINQGILSFTGFIDNEHLNEQKTWSLGLLQLDFFYRKRPWYAGQFVRKIKPKSFLDKNLNSINFLFFNVMLNNLKQKLKNILVRDIDKTFKDSFISLPTKNNQIDFNFIENFINAIQKLILKNIYIWIQSQINNK
ncbi:restriction endonuclease subunit S [Mycoplasmopsis felis]|uniref:restriction endonuclease subunit S n=1 Tax=Mycoplasmopsis felis TaxID=33923 RepID=UPI002AFF03CB|nr:restriction endonuclease subunit S [Mycoplasmopsis felis]WQQ04923.1 restriction endonuclease subunit S [Mycoplasmopsis felis]